jgi:Ca2+-binding EF-hand superfamily protein
MASFKAKYGMQDRHVFQLQQALLGALKRYDDEGNQTLHPASLQKALETLGLNFGDEIVDKMMVMCRTNENGDVDYSRFESHLESGVRSSEGEQADDEDYEGARRQTRLKATHSVQQLNPFEDREMADQREDQAQKLRDRRKELHALFTEFDHRQIEVDAFLEGIQGLGIQVTHDLVALTNRNNVSGMKFAQVMIALSRLGNTNESQKMHAGATSSAEAGGDVFRRRTDPWKNRATFGQTEVRAEGTKGKIPNSNAAKVQNLMKSMNIEASMKVGDTPVKPLSSTREELQSGILKPAADTLSSEQRVVRQQVFAAIRKMDSGELTASQFKDRMMQIGIELPPDIFKLLIDHNASGAATFNTFASAFERLLEERDVSTRARVSAVDELYEGMKTKLQSYDSILILQRVSQSFKEKDIRGTGRLTLTDFIPVMKQYWPEMDEKDCVAVFNAQDPAGTGATNHQGIIQKLRGPMGQSRVDIIRQAYGQLPKNNAAAVSADTLQARFQANMHPDVRVGKMRGSQAVTEFNDTFELDANDLAVTAKGFENYYSNLGAMIDSDEEFADLLRSCWGLSSKEPPPMNFKQTADGTFVAAPAAAQHHGNVIAWKHEAGILEKSAVKSGVRKTGSGFTQKSSFTLSHNAVGDTAVEKPLFGKGGKKRMGNSADLVRQALKVDARKLAPTGGVMTRTQTVGSATEESDSFGPAAGSVSVARHPHGVRENRTLSTFAQKHSGTETPYGVSSPTEKGPQSGGGTKVMSLRDHIKQREIGN